MAKAPQYIEVTQEMLNVLTALVRKHGLAFVSKKLVSFAEDQHIKGPADHRSASEMLSRIVNKGKHSVTGWMFECIELFLVEEGFALEARDERESNLLIEQPKAEVVVTGRGEVVSRLSQANQDWHDKYEDKREENLRLTVEVKALKAQLADRDKKLAEVTALIHSGSKYADEVYALARRVVLAEATDADLLELARVLLREEQ